MKSILNALAKVVQILSSAGTPVRVINDTDKNDEPYLQIIGFSAMATVQLPQEVQDLIRISEKNGKFCSYTAPYTPLKNGKTYDKGALYIGQSNLKEQTSEDIMNMSI